MNDPFADMPAGRTLRRLFWVASLVGGGFLIYAGWFVILKPHRSASTTAFLIFWTCLLIFIEAKNTRDLWRADARDRRRALEGIASAPRSASVEDLRTNFQSLRGWPRFHLIAAVVGFLGGATCLVLTYIVATTSLDVPVFILFGLIFPTFGAAVIRGASRQPRRSGGLFSRPAHPQNVPAWQWKRLPNVARVGLPVLFVALWLQGLFAITSVQGQPGKHGGHYYANDHGDLIPLTAAQYRHAVAVQQRIFATGDTAFYMAAAVIIWVMPPRREDGNAIV